MLTFLEIQLAFEIAVFAAVFSDILIMPGNLLGRYGEMIDKLPSFWAKPLGNCAACFGGQIGFWYFTFWRFDVSFVFASRLLFFSSFVILFSFLLSAAIRLARRQ